MSEKGGINMVREIMLYTSNDLRDFMHLACASPLDIGVHTMDNQIADGKSVLGLMAIDYKKPVKVVSWRIENFWNS